MAPNIDGGDSSGTPTTIPDFAVTQEILLVVGQQLQDVTGKTWPPDALLPYINIAIAKIIELNPGAYPVRDDITLVAGAKQTLLDNRRITDAVCNVVGTAAGKAVTLLARKNLDALISNWQNFTASPDVLHVIMDEHDPYSF